MKVTKEEALNKLLEYYRDLREHGITNCRTLENGDIEYYYFEWLGFHGDEYKSKEDILIRIDLDEPMVKVWNPQFDDELLAKEIQLVNNIVNPIQPTAEDVCKALSEWLEIKVTFNNVKSFVFENGYNYTENISTRWVEEKGDEVLYTIDYPLPPHLITMIGRFYEEVKK